MRRSTCSMPPRCFTRPHSSTSGGWRKKSPDVMACEIRTMSCGTTRPAPRFKCPTSLLPIWPSGSPTASPDALRSVRGARLQRRCHTGVSPSSTALPSRPGRKPQPSSTIRTTGVRGPRLFAILEGMQSSRALRALPVVLWLVPSLSLAAQARYRVTTDGAWFYQEPEGKRLARLARGTIVVGGESQDAWQGVTLEGWIFATPVGPTPPAAHGAVPRARGRADRHVGAVGAAARAGTLGRLDARRARGVGEEHRSGDRAARRPDGDHGGRTAHRPAALRGAGAALDAAVHRC